MAASPEDLLGLNVPAPLSFTVFPDLPPTPHEEPQSDLTLDCISRMLMGEDIFDKSFYQYPDHQMLLQVEQPFAQILSTYGTTSSNAPLSAPNILDSAVLPSRASIMHIKDRSFSLIDTVTVEPNSSEEISSMQMLLSMAVLEGMQEANKFLPTKNGIVDGRGRKNRFDGDGETEAAVGRRSKQLVMPVQPDLESEQEATTREMLDRLIINGEDLCGLVKKKKEEHQSILRKVPRARPGTGQAVVADLDTLLIRCAEAVATNNQRSAGELLERIKQYSTPIGNATQRLAHHFAQGLEARLTGTGSKLYLSLVEKRTSVVDLVKAYNLFIATCCFFKVSFLFSNKTIYNATAGRKKLHLVHYGISNGIQWPDLLQLLAAREGGPPEVRITAISSHPAERIEEAGCRLSHCASKLGVPFKFRAILAKPEAVRAEDLNIDPDEMLVVYSLFYFKNLTDECLGLNNVSPRDSVLNTIRMMKPSVFINGIVNGSYSTAFFMTRFRQTLFSYRAMFDMMENIVPRDSNERLLVERDIFAPSAINIIACEGADRVERPQDYREWQAWKQRAGLRQLPLDPNVVHMLKDHVKNQYHKNFVISEDDRWLLLGWKGRVLYALSTWTVDNDRSFDSA